MLPAAEKWSHVKGNAHRGASGRQSGAEVTGDIPVAGGRIRENQAELSRGPWLTVAKKAWLMYWE